MFVISSLEPIMNSSINLDFTRDTYDDLKVSPKTAWCSSIKVGCGQFSSPEDDALVMVRTDEIGTATDKSNGKSLQV